MEQEQQFILESSNSLKVLAGHLCAHIRDQQPAVFDPVYIITQTDGMNSWLTQQIAETLGIAANISFLKPNDLINRVYAILGGRFSASISSHDLNWLIYKELNESDFISAFPQIASYYRIGDEGRDVKRMALAEKIADLFDQYQVYRPGMIDMWNSDRLATTQKHELWQKYLWIKVKDVAGEMFFDKTRMGKHILNELDSPQQAENLTQKMPALYLFGISVITEYHLQIIQKLSTIIPVKFLVVNPSPSLYWYEDKSEKVLAWLRQKGIVAADTPQVSNPLLTAWGSVIQDTFMMLFQSEEILNSYSVIGEKEQPENSLLQKIQNQVLRNDLPGESDYFSVGELTDGSVTIHSCFSPAREAEVLYNYLVHLVAGRKEQLSSRDIVVMVSDIDLYASYIRAVFDNAPYRFRYTIADETFTTSDNILNALQAVLSLSEQNFTSEEIVRLLDFSCIRKSFLISDLDLIRRAVDAANIRFGIEGDHADDTIYVSWRYGLKRIMYGVCISGEVEYGTGADSFFPLDIAESSGAHQLIRFQHFVSMLIDSLEARKIPKSIAGWVEYVRSVVKITGSADTLEGEEYGLLLSRLENYNDVNEIFAEKIGYDVFIHSFLPALSSTKRSSAFAGGGITFCSLIPMRSIPFKVVALLGMNFDSFPRKDQKVNFNLMEYKKRKGDRNIKENDKHLFLETLLSAGDYFYLSYIGQNTKDNSRLPPSILVDEFVDYIESFSQDPDRVRETMVVKQPLHGFSPKYRAGKEPFYSYLLKNEQREPLTRQEFHESPELSENVSLSDLISFFKDPVKAYYNKVAGIYYQQDDIALPQTELFEPGHLDKWQIKTSLLELDKDQAERFRMKLVKTGGLPLKNMSEVVMEQMEREIVFVKDAYRELSGGVDKSVISRQLVFADGTLEGDLEPVYEDRMIFYSFSKNEISTLLKAYISGLFAVAAGVSPDIVFISSKKEKIFRAMLPGRDHAYTKLEEFLAIFREGHQNILPFSPSLTSKISDIPAWNQETWRKNFENAAEHNAYLSKEIAEGLSQKESAFQKYREVAEKVLSPLVEIFPEYFKQ